MSGSPSINVTPWVTNPDTGSLRKLDITQLSTEEDLIESEQDTIVAVRGDGEHIKLSSTLLVRQKHGMYLWRVSSRQEKDVATAMGSL